MARYIDADKFAERIKASPIFPNMGQDGYFIQEFVLDLIDRTADADVVEKGKENGLTLEIDGAYGYFPKPYIIEAIKTHMNKGNRKALIKEIVDLAEEKLEIFDEIEREINDALQSNYEVLPQIEESEALWNRVNGKIDALRGMRGFIDGLKEKYEA